MGGGRWPPGIAARAASIGASARRWGLLGSLGPENLTAEQSVRNESSIALPAAIVSSENVGEVAAAVRRPAAWDWDMDDWEFATDEGDLRLSSMEPLPRVVFGGVPSYEEAEAAAAQLKDAVEKIGGSDLANQDLNLPRLLEHGSGTMSVATGESSGAPAVPLPSHAAEALSLLHKSPAAQSVVASIASDPSMWNAVLRNEAFMDYFQSQRTRVTEFSNELRDEESSVEDDHRSEGWTITKKFDKFCDAFDQFDFLESKITNMVQNIKLTVVEMATSVSTYFRSIFSLTEAQKEAAADTGSGSGFFDRTLGTSFMGLAMLVIMVVLLRRA